MTHDELAALRTENARLIALLEAHGIAWRLPPPTQPSIQNKSRLSTEAKVSLFRRLFRGRDDVYPVRWESKTTGKSGYMPACANEWRPGICGKPKGKCSECGSRQLLPLTDAVVFDHLAGHHTIGVYPLLEDETCLFLAIDFDEAEWREDSLAFLRSCQEFAVPAALEISRSGKGAHVWIFFNAPVLARDARRLGTALISHTCAQTRQLKLSSYDRLFPNQDTMPRGGFGNLIALPLQKKPRESGCSVFVDAALQPYPDQWAFLASVKPMMPADIESTICLAAGGQHPLDVTFIDEEDLAIPWQRSNNAGKLITGELPATLNVVLANQIYFEKAQLPQALANRLIRLAAFQNPAFYQAQAMRMSVWDKPRVIGCADNYPQHIALPRGCFEAVCDLLQAHHIKIDLKDERNYGEPVAVCFRGALRADQDAAVAAMLQHDTGVLSAPTAFGKTVTAAAIIARRSVNTLILVHRTELLRQWQERLQAFLDIDKSLLGTIGGGTNKPTGKIDIAVMQSLSRHGEVDPVVENYGQIIIDECHHIGAVSFDLILKHARARYLLGLTATPIRRDGLQPIIFMRCGSLRHTASRSENAPVNLLVQPRICPHPINLPTDAKIQDVFRHLASDISRICMIVDDIQKAYEEQGRILVLSERTEHLDAILAELNKRSITPFVLLGRMTRKKRATLIAELEALSPDARRILLATGRLIGEGFDHPPLDTLILAMPVSWKGTLQQYVGRLHREHADKTRVRVIDYVDSSVPVLMRMWEKRQRGYKALGYRIEEEGSLID